MGLLMLLLLGAVSFAALALLGVGRRLWTLAGAALCLGAIGYAWQGKPLLPAAPASTTHAIAPIDAEGTALRDNLLGSLNAETPYLVASDAMIRAGEPAAAARVALGGLSRMPRSFVLWTWLGVTLAAAEGDQVAPPALLAFRQAGRLAPEHPAPPFYLGLSYVRAGEFARARPLWARALSLSPADTSYRRDIAVRLALLDRVIAVAGNRR